MKKRTTDNIKSYLAYLNKLVDQYNNTCHHFINTRPINASYSALTETNEANSKAPKIKVNDIVSVTRYNNIPKIGFSEILRIIDSVLKTNPRTCNIKDLN